MRRVGAAPMRENPVMASSRRRPDPDPAGSETSATGGLRERKKLKTRMAIQREAMRLFEHQGYDATTIEQIAEAVEISPSTFFNYFPSKEDVVFTDPYDPLFISAFLARPSDEPVLDAIRHTVNESLGAVFERDRDVILARTRLIMSVPALGARVWEDVKRTLELFCTVVAERLGRDPGDFELRVATMSVISAMTMASMEWARTDGSADMMDLINRALDVVEAGGLNAIAPGPAPSSKA
jgi:AcrR family transcriptional regulator